MGQVIRTATGISYPIEWCGVASMDGILRFYVKDGNLVELTSIFSEEQNFPLTHLFDGEVVQTYDGYTRFFGVNLDFVGGATVAIAKE